MKSQRPVVNEFASKQLWEADSWLVGVAEQHMGASPGAIPEVEWENTGCAQLCLEDAYTALTEREISKEEYEALTQEGAPVVQDMGLLPEDDPRLIKLLELHDRLRGLVANRPPDARDTIADTLDELRELCQAFGFPHQRE